LRLRIFQFFMFRCIGLALLLGWYSVVFEDMS
jgi:hypothetical protein